ncbi:MAG: ABC transporter ATP-binding protein [Candidatus Bathyarchaeia archaeon]
MGSLAVLEDVWKVYRVGNTEYPALKGVNLSIDEGEFLAVVGPSGSGKSTLLHVLGGLDKPTKGKIIVRDMELTRLNSSRLSEYQNKVIGFVFQFYNLLPYLTAVENVELPLAIAGVEPRKRRTKALNLLEMFGLGGMAFKKPTELSGGEQQRVAIVRALVNDPSMVLADEPTGNLDSKNAELVVETFKKLTDERGMSVVMVSHNLELTKYCSKIVKLRDGEIVEIEEM